MAEENAYQLLGVVPEATEADIKKAYRKLALLKHPDKNPDNPLAADEFAALQKAYDLLLDPEARKALDNLLSAKAVRAERTAFHDEKRRKMMEDLERRERQWEQARSQEETARARLQQEIVRLRRQAVEREAKAQADRRAAAATAAAATAPEAAAAEADAVPGAGGEDLAARLSRTLKVSWSRRDGEYSTQQLRQIFAVHGEVEDVVMREGKKKKKGSALVVMATPAGAAAAARSVNGELDRPLLVVPFNKAVGGDEEESDAGQQPTQHAGPAFAAAAAEAGMGGQGRPAVQRPAFAAVAQAGSGALGSKPSGPLFAAGAGAMRSSAAPRPSLFPSAAANGSNASSRPLFAAAGGATSGTGTTPFTSFKAASFAGMSAPESATLAKLRQAEERRRLLAQMEQEEGG